MTNSHKGPADLPHLVNITAISDRALGSVSDGPMTDRRRT